MAPRIEKRTRKDYPEGVPSYGTDALRFTYCALASTGRDVNFNLKRIEGYRNFCNKLWNAARFVLMNCEEADLSGPTTLSLADRWIRSRSKTMIEASERAINTYRFDVYANVVYDFNLGSIIRTANAFLAGEVVIYGRRKADLRGAMGSYVYENLVHIPDAATLDTFVADRGYTTVCFEETKGAIPLAELRWPAKPLMIFGQEGPGVPNELLERAAHTVHIPQYGSIRSLNVSVAAGIAMHDWLRLATLA